MCIRDRVIVTKGTALETVTTGEDGSASYSVDLPISNGYYISETQAPYAYIRNPVSYTHLDVYKRQELYSAFSSECDKENEEIVLCGLSLGALINSNCNCFSILSFLLLLYSNLSLIHILSFSRITMNMEFLQSIFTISFSIRIVSKNNVL